MIPLLGGCVVQPEKLDIPPSETVGSAESAVAPCTLPSDRPLTVESQPRDSMDTAGFIDEVVDALGNDYMGYSALLIGQAGEIIGSAKYGWARTRCEPEGERAFSHQTQTAWGSVTKVLTTALVIDKVERSSQSLDETMWSNLPAAWRWDMIEANSPHMAVRIRDLLSHHSGFSGSNSFTLRERVTGGLEKSLSFRDYSNANFAIFQHMGRFFREGYFDDLEASYSSTEIPLDAYLELLSLSIYVDTMQERVADPLGIAFSCNEPEHAGANFARYYKGGNTEKGYLLNPVDKTGCTTGGVVMSPLDMAKFLRALTQTDQIIDHDNYVNEMAIPETTRLGWDYAVSVTGGRMYGKNGARNFGSGGVIPGNPGGSSYSEIVAFPNGVMALITTNSRRPDGAPRFNDVLADAYDASVTP